MFLDVIEQLYLISSYTGQRKPEDINKVGRILYYELYQMIKLFITVYVPKCLSDIVSGLIECFEILFLKKVKRLLVDDLLF